MRKLSKIMSVAALFAFVVAPVSALAQAPGGGGNQGGASRPDTSQIREQAEARAEENRTGAEERKSEIMKQVEERRAQIKKEVCERQQQTLTSVMPRLAQGATSVKSSMDTVYLRVAGFYESGQLTVENYDILVGNVETAKANAEAAIATIENQTFTLDCDNPSVGQQLDGYRLAVQSTQAALNDYKKALVELISAMRAAASFEQGNNSGGAASDAQNREQSQGGEENE